MGDSLSFAVFISGIFGVGLDLTQRDIEIFKINSAVLIKICNSFGGK